MGLSKPAKLIHQTVIGDNGGNEPWLGLDQGKGQGPCFVWGSGGEEAGEEDVGGAVVGKEAGGEEEGETLVGFGETVGVAEGVDEGGEVVVVEGGGGVLLFMVEGVVVGVWKR